MIESTVVVRRKPGHDPIDMNQFIGCPPRQRLSEADFAQKYGASQQDIDDTVNHLTANGLQVLDTDLTKRHIKVRGTIAQHNAAYRISVQNHSKTDHHGKHFHFRAHGDLTLPSHLVPVYIAHLGIADQLRAIPMAAETPANSFQLSPQSVQALYNSITGAAGETIALFGFDHSNSDVQQTMANWNLPNPTIVEVSVEGGTPYATEGLAEGNLDIAIASAFGQGAVIAMYYAVQPLSSNSWLQVIQRVAHPIQGDPICTIFSASLGFTGNVEEISPAAVLAMDAGAQDAALQGVTLLCASGDGGSANFSDNGGVYAGYPGASPWFTSVGGTTIGNIQGSNTTDPAFLFQEWVWNERNLDGNNTTTHETTGGGVSIVFPLPSYQAGYSIPVSLQSGTVGRGFPDIAGNSSTASGYDVFINGVLRGVSGTSLAAPQYAGMLACVNRALGRSVGFINPTLYALGTNLIYNASSITTAGQSITDNQGHVYTLVTSVGNGLRISVDGTLDTNTSNVIRLLYYIPSGTMFQENNAGNWYYRALITDSYVQRSNPLSFLEILRDISGVDGGEQSNAYLSSPGYPVGVGWDACTGLGVLQTFPFYNWLHSLDFITVNREGFYSNQKRAVIIPTSDTPFP